MRTLKLNVILLCLATLGLSAQQKVSKTKQTLEVNKDVTIDLNTSYVEIEVDTWNKGSVEIEAYLESDELNEAQLQEAAKKWNLDIDGAVDYVTIKSRGSKAVYYASSSGDYAVYLEDLEKQLANMPQMPEMPQVAAMPQMPEMPEMPEFPELPELPKGVKTIEFDVDAYKRDGQAYMDKWSAEYEEKYGKDFKKEMEVWAKKFADSDYQKKMEAWGEAYAEKFEGKWAEDMEKWGEEFGEEWAEKIEKWGEEFGKDFEKQIESWARRYEREMEREARNIERQVREMERREGRREDREKLYEEREKVREEAMKAREEAMKIGRAHV